MQIPNDYMLVLQSLGAFAYDPSTDPELAQKLQMIPGSAVDKLFTSLEILYTFRDKLSPEGLSILGQVAGYCDAQGWEVPGKPGRLKAVHAGARRDLGESGTFLKPEDDPEPLKSYREDGMDWREKEEVLEPAIIVNP